jgi:small subunit ribosomal protein S15
MALSQEKKVENIKKFQTHRTDTGSSSVQIATLTARIKEISDHLKTHKKDFSGERGLLKLVGQRRRLLSYLKKHNFEEYQKITKALEVRK